MKNAFVVNFYSMLELRLRFGIWKHKNKNIQPKNSYGFMGLGNLLW